jgi:hypothetical protein
MNRVSGRTGPARDVGEPADDDAEDLVTVGDGDRRPAACDTGR